MILQQKIDSDVVKVGQTVERQFTVLSNSKMFDILSDKLYSDKMMAPIRELSTNAYDAGIEAGLEGHDFKVHVPTFDEDWFSVTDHGNGMDAEEIEELYSVYGMSSKENTNSMVGCLGLGSKSPFAYTDAFTVDSVKGGKRYVYRCFMENGVPKMARLLECDSTERSGVCVKFNVKSQDIAEFSVKCASFFSYWREIPEFEGGVPLMVSDFSSKVFVDICGVRVVSDPYSGWGPASIKVMMGNVVYGCSYESICSSFSETKVKNWISGLNRCIVVAEVPIGSVTMTVSRETIDDTPENAKVVASVIEMFYFKLFEKVQKDVDGDLPLIEKCRLMKKYASVHFVDKDGMSFKTLKDKCVYTFADSSKLGVSYYDNWHKGASRVVPKAQHFKDFNYHRLFTSSNVVFFSAKRSNYMFPMMKELENINRNYVSDGFYLVFDKGLSDFLVSSGIEVKTLDCTQRSAKPSCAVERNSVFMANPYRCANRHSDCVWEQVKPEDIPDSTVPKPYVILNKFVPENIDGANIDISSSWKSICDVLGIKSVYGIRKSALKLLGKRHDFVPLEKYVEEFRRTRLPKFIDNMARLFFKNTVDSYDSSFEKYHMFAVCDDDIRWLSKMSKMCMSIDEKKIVSFGAVYCLFMKDVVSGEHAYVDKLKEIENSISIKFPLVPMVMELISGRYRARSDMAGFERKVFNELLAYKKLKENRQ